MNTITQSEIELSERLRKACLEKGITEPRFVAQDADGGWMHFIVEPCISINFWHSQMEFDAEADMDADEVELFMDESTANWRETLMEWNPKAEVPIADVIEYTCEHCGQRI